MSFKNGQVVSFRAEGLTENYSAPLFLAVIVAEQGLAPGAIPEETVEIAPGYEANPDRTLAANQIRVACEPNTAERAAHIIVVDCGLVRTIPRSWIIQDRGSVSASGLQQIEDAVKAYL